MSDHPIKLKYVGAVGDTSGYANACRNYICALLDTNEIDLSVGIASFEKTKTSHGPAMERIAPYVNRPIKPKIQITHLTPENYPAFKTPGAYNIAYTVWETEMLPHGWVDLINSMDEVWVPSDWNIEIFKKSGIRKPMFKVPHVIPIPSGGHAKHVTVPTQDNETYVFYSIFQWIERKNPLALLRAYFTEFGPKDNVCLALKSYRLDSSAQEKAIVKGDIKTCKQSLNLPYYPPVIFFGDLMPAEYIHGLHERGDCFVMAQRGEGFGIPHAEAMAHGNPVIATGYGGNMEFMNKETAFPVDCQRTPVAGMIFANYHGHMVWAEPNIMHMREHMRFCYENRDRAKDVGKTGREFIEHNYSSKAIGKLMLDRLREIEKGL